MPGLSHERVEFDAVGHPENYDGSMRGCPSSAMNATRFLCCVLAVMGVTAAKAESLVPKFRTCLAIQDRTKERLECYDRIVRPQPRKVTQKPISILECRFPKEEDERLACYNKFVLDPFPRLHRPGNTW